MGTVIYSANPIQAFLGTAATTLVVFALGMVGAGSALFRESQRLASRLRIGGASALLLVFSAISAVNMLASASKPTQSVVMHLQQKRVVQDNCNNGQTCTRYVLEATSSTGESDFTVPYQAYVNAQDNTCYQFTYYVNPALYGVSSTSYQQVDTLARIETADPSRCH